MGDGSLGARTALLGAPYADKPDSCGMGIVTQEQLDEMILWGHSHGMQIAVHAIGDGMMERVVLAYQGGSQTRDRPLSDHYGETFE